MINCNLKTYDGARISPSDDALLYDLMLGKQSGIICGCEVKGIDDSFIKIAKGFGVIHGRLFEITGDGVRENINGMKINKNYLILLKYSKGVLSITSMENDEIITQEIAFDIVSKLNRECQTIDDDYYMPIAACTYIYADGNSNMYPVYNVINNTTPTLKTFDEFFSNTEYGKVMDAMLEKKQIIQYTGLFADKDSYVLDTAYADYPYRYDIPVENVDENYIPFVMFIVSGNEVLKKLSNFAFTGNKKLSVYAKEKMKIYCSATFIRANGVKV